MPTIPPDQWYEQGQYDLDTAQAMFDTKRYVYVLFCCQQAIEKTLKGVIAAKTGEAPPRIHQLMRLLELSGLRADPQAASFIREVSDYYFQTRYPEQIRSLANAVSATEAKRVLDQTREVVAWLLSIK